ncbi:hypothetical protein WOLCODRAFT_75800, partial [Wolfiporia cocos MD-104 SS10]
RYPALKQQHPCEGRRRWWLRAADAFWALPADEKAAWLAAYEEHEMATDDDPHDAFAEDAPGLGILVRTDYTDDAAWRAFCEKLREGEAEFVPARPPAAEGSTAEESPDAGAARPGGDDDAMDDDDDEGEEEEKASPAIFAIVDAPPADRARYTGISNLAALRLFNEVDVRRAPTPPQGTRRVRPQNRLVDYDGFQEIYGGKTLWIYDAKSNADQCARLVSRHGGPYGTATGDSWRARVAHICELQVNLTAGAMTIDFGGMDRWDYPERVRNLEEAARPTS